MRRFRQNLESCCWATATSRFEGLDDATEPFFELFRSERLDRLDTVESRRLWRVVSGDDVPAREIRPLQILTGGSPRLLVFVADFARHRSLRQLMEQLVRLIDDHTEYFRSHLEGFAKTERRVYLAILDLWQPSTPREITTRARLDVRTVSTMLSRLVNRGAVIAEGGGRKRLYSGAERLYGIYYKLRRERDDAAVVSNLIRFMAVFYSAPELAQSNDAIEAFRNIYVAHRHGSEFTLKDVIGLAIDLTASGCPERALLEIVTSDEKKSDELSPLVVALRRRAGEVVRAPVEVMEVADDIIEQFNSRMVSADAPPRHPPA